MEILHTDIHLLDLEARLPFKYGIATMTDVPYAFLRLQVEIDGQTHNGYAADNLPPKWFTKIPETPLGEEMVEMLRVIEHAREAAVGMEAGSPLTFGWISTKRRPNGASQKILPRCSLALAPPWSSARSLRPPAELSENLLPQQ